MPACSTMPTNASRCPACSTRPGAGTQATTAGKPTPRTLPGHNPITTLEPSPTPARHPARPQPASSCCALLCSPGTRSDSSLPLSSLRQLVQMPILVSIWIMMHACVHVVLCAAQAQGPAGPGAEQPAHMHTSIHMSEWMCPCVACFVRRRHKVRLILALSNLWNAYKGPEKYLGWALNGPVGESLRQVRTYVLAACQPVWSVRSVQLLVVP